MVLVVLSRRSLSWFSIVTSLTDSSIILGLGSVTEEPPLFSRIEPERKVAGKEKV